MELTLRFDMDNEAFEDDPLTEAARILRNAALRMDGGSWGGPLMDVNGNKVGSFEISED